MYLSTAHWYLLSLRREIREVLLKLPEARDERFLKRARPVGGGTRMSSFALAAVSKAVGRAILREEGVGARRGRSASREAAVPYLRVSIGRSFGQGEERTLSGLGAVCISISEVDIPRLASIIVTKFVASVRARDVPVSFAQIPSVPSCVLSKPPTRDEVERSLWTISFVRRTG